jgi:hypothetical protein
VAVADQLPGTRPVRRKAHAVDNIVQPGLHNLKENLTRNAFLSRGLLEAFSELPLKHAVTVADLLFFS